MATDTAAAPAATSELTEKWFALNVVLAEQMIPALDKFIAGHNGYPVELTEERWVEHLTTMRDGFAAFLDIDAGNYADTVEYRILSQRVDRGMTALATWFEHLWD